MEYPEFGLARQVADIRHFQSVAQIRFVAAIAIHRIRIGNARERTFDAELRRNLPHQPRVEALDEVQYIIFIDETHFEVELRKFRLAIRPQVFIPKTSRNLEIPLHAAHH